MEHKDRKENRESPVRWAMWVQQAQKALLDHLVLKVHEVQQDRPETTDHLVQLGPLGPPDHGDPLVTRVSPAAERLSVPKFLLRRSKSTMDDTPNDWTVHFICSLHVNRTPRSHRSKRPKR